ncbi:hypothetical protein GCM10022243_61980 [Saccharothrix violaceirubra]|uniref:Uncharacterized protein (UPF0147 family) n=1 Tax=Saccharothrix violaceirubra TaxID=413306 RepID=A0A7W7T7U2_9PSEU|nr:hypothetical protein [Saccharothrix violaceirubra]MBB4968174.1 uncharacterized protein (UPF0147 family) [Saccharothrix violaceirubra]
MNAYTDLVRELKSLRKGRGVLAGRIGERVGPTLRATCGVTDDDEPRVIRRKVSDRLVELAGMLPADLRAATLAAFAIDQEARFPLYQDRVHWTAVRMDRDPRTIRRRVDEAINHLAELATEPPERPVVGSDGWRTTELHAVLVLDRSRPEVIERHRIVAERDGLRELALVSPFPAVRSAPDMHVLYGGTLVDRAGPVLAMPAPLAAGECHDFSIRFRPKALGVGQPGLVYVPRQPCDLLELRGRFGPHAPSHVWTVRGTDRDRSGDRHPVDGAGEFRMRFRLLKPGLAYGVRWQVPGERCA